MGLPLAGLERPMRRSFDTAFTYVVALIVVSVLGTLSLVSVVFAGVGLLSGVYTIRTALSRGLPPTTVGTARLFFAGCRTHRRGGAVLSALLVVLVSLTASVVFVFLTARSVLIAGIGFASLVVFAVEWVAFPLFVVLYERTGGLRRSIEESLVLVVANPRYALGTALVIASVAVLSTLTVVGWALIGFGFQTLFAVLATDRCYKAMTGDRVLEGG